MHLLLLWGEMPQGARKHRRVRGSASAVRGVVLGAVGRKDRGRKCQELRPSAQGSVEEKIRLRNRLKPLRRFVSTRVDGMGVTVDSTGVTAQERAEEKFRLHYRLGGLYQPEWTVRATGVTVESGRYGG